MGNLSSEEEDSFLKAVRTLLQELVHSYCFSHNSVLPTFGVWARCGVAGSMEMKGIPSALRNALLAEENLTCVELLSRGIRQHFSAWVQGTDVIMARAVNQWLATGPN